MSTDREPTEDELLGMVWWNGLYERARALRLQRAGSAVVADAWALFKANPGNASEIGLQERHELACANAGDTLFDAEGLELYGVPAGPARH